jgi:hypothetical protein
MERREPGSLIDGFSYQRQGSLLIAEGAPLLLFAVVALLVVGLCAVLPRQGPLLWTGIV